MLTGMTVKKHRPFADRLRALMAARGISQFEFARTFGLDQSSVSRYLGGREPRLSVYLKMVAKYPELGA